MIADIDQANRKVVVAVGPDDLDHKLIKFVALLQGRLPGSVHLVYAIEPWQGAAWLSTYPGESVSFAIGKVVEDKAYEQAEGLLSEGVELLRSAYGIEATYVIKKGLATEVVLSEAHDAGGNFVVCGVNPSPGSFLDKGFSTAIGLANRSHLPVLLVPLDVEAFDGEQVRILICDDLRDESLTMLSATLRLASICAPAKVQHVHIARLGAWDLRSLPSYVLSAFTSGILSQKKGMTQAELVDGVEAHLQSLMTTRADGGMQWVKKPSQVNYKAEVRFGEPATEIVKLAQLEKPDIVSMGRHETIHRRPFGLGKVSIQAALRCGRPLLIWPDSLELLPPS